MKEPPHLDDRVIREDLQTLIIAVDNKVDREFPAVYGAIPSLQFLVHANIKITKINYDVIRYILADYPEDNARKASFCIAAFPIARTILDSLFSIVFLFDNPVENAKWYMRSSWREHREELDRFMERYSADPDFNEYIENRNKWLTESADEMLISKEERFQMTRIPYWPVGHQMIKHQKLSAPRKAFLEYLNKWFYGSLSSASHLSGPRLIPAMLLLKGMEGGGPLSLTFQRYKSEAMFTAITLQLAILSECISQLDLEYREKAKYLWVILGDYWPPTKEIYSNRYQSLLKDHGS